MLTQFALLYPFPHSLLPLCLPTARLLSNLAFFFFNCSQGGDWIFYRVCWCVCECVLSIFLDLFPDACGFMPRDKLEYTILGYNLCVFSSKCWFTFVISEYLDIFVSTFMLAKKNSLPKEEYIFWFLEKIPQMNERGSYGPCTIA